MDLVSFNEVVRGLYDAAAGLYGWQAALEKVSLFTGSWFVQLVGVDKTNGRIAFSLQSNECPIDGLMDYVREYHQSDPHMNQAMRNPIGIAYNGERVVPPRLMPTNPFYRDFYAPYNARYTIGTRLVEDDELLSFVALIRQSDQRGYEIDEERQFELLAYHIAAAVQIMRRVSTLQIQAGVGQALLEQTTRPSFLLEPNRALRFANEAGKRTIDESGLLVLRSGFLGCMDHESDAKMIERLEMLSLQSGAATDGSTPTRIAFGIRSIKDGHVTPACLWSVRPEGTMGAFGATTLALLTVADAGASSLDPVVLASMYNLTPAEARVAIAIDEGLVVKEIASRQRVTNDAIRYHIKNLLRKVGVANQRELVVALRSVSML